MEPQLTMWGPDAAPAAPRTTTSATTSVTWTLSGSTHPGEQDRTQIPKEKTVFFLLKIEIFCLNVAWKWLNNSAVAALLNVICSVPKSKVWSMFESWVSLHLRSKTTVYGLGGALLRRRRSTGRCTCADVRDEACSNFCRVRWVWGPVWFPNSAFRAEWLRLWDVSNLWEEKKEWQGVRGNQKLLWA